MLLLRCRHRCRRKRRRRHHRHRRCLCTSRRLHRRRCCYRLLLAALSLAFCLLCLALARCLPVDRPHVYCALSRAQHNSESGQRTDSVGTTRGNNLVARRPTLLIKKPTSLTSGTWGRWISVAPQGLLFFPPQALTEGGKKRKQVELTLYAENVTIWCESD